MRDTIKGVILGAVVAASVTALLAQTPSWTNPRTWATDDLLTADQFNEQFRDNFLNLRANAACAETGIRDTPSATTALFGDCRWATVTAFDIYDDVGTSATIADSDRLPFSDESLSGDPMRFTTAALLADYMQGEVDLNASRVTSGIFVTGLIPNLSASKITTDTFSVDRIPNLPASKLPAPPAVTIDALGCSGTPSADTVLFGDCRWDSIPATTVVALDMDTTTTTASTYQTVGPTASLSVSTGQEVEAYVSGSANLQTGCTLRIQNTSTATTLDTSTNTIFRRITAIRVVDSGPSTTTPNVYAIQLRSTSMNACSWGPATDWFRFSAAPNRGFIAVVTG